MPSPQGLLLCLGFLVLTVGGIAALSMGMLLHSAPLFMGGLIVGLMGISLLVVRVRMAIKNLQVAVPGHSLLHPRTGTRFDPQQAIALQRRLDQIRREMSENSVSTRPEPEPNLPSTPPPWTMEPPPSYDTVMKIKELGMENGTEHGEEHGEQGGEQRGEQRGEEHGHQLLTVLL